MVDYPPQIGTLVSEMTWMRTKVVRTVKGLTTDQLDYLLDDKANRIGALLRHLAATERIYQLMTLESGIPFWAGDDFDTAQRSRSGLHADSAAFPRALLWSKPRS